MHYRRHRPMCAIDAEQLQQIASRRYRCRGIAGDISPEHEGAVECDGVRRRTLLDFHTKMLALVAGQACQGGVHRAHVDDARLKSGRRDRAGGRSVYYALRVGANRARRDD